MEDEAAIKAAKKKRKLESKLRVKKLI